jgi:neutral trehalase
MQLRRYGFNIYADRTSYNFLSMVAENFRHHGTIREKYDAVTRSSETAVKSGLYNNERPDTWVTVWTGHIGDTSSPRGGSDALEGVFGYG